MEIDKHLHQNQEELSLKCCKFETFVYIFGIFQTFERNTPFKLLVLLKFEILLFEVTNDCEENPPRMRMVSGGRRG